jgi:hypothetical protein
MSATQELPPQGEPHLYVLPVAPDHPHAQDKRADDEQDAYELSTRRVIGLSVHDGRDPECDGKKGNDGDNDVLHGVFL